MSNKETKQKRKNALGGTMSDEMWRDLQNQSAKGSDMTITEGDDDFTKEFIQTCQDVSEAFDEAIENAPEGELNESEAKLLEEYEARKRLLK